VDQNTIGVTLLAALLLAGCGTSPEARLRAALAAQTTGIIRLPQGTIEISSELTLAPGAHDLEIVGNETRLKAADARYGTRRAVASETLNHNLAQLRVWYAAGAIKEAVGAGTTGRAVGATH